MTRILLTLLLVSAFTTNVYGAESGVLTGRVKVKHRGKTVKAKAVVYLKSVPKAAPRKRKATVVQKYRKFIPKWLVVTKGTRVSFPNRDNYTHNVFSETRGSKFNFGKYRPGTTKSTVFRKPGEVDVQCNIHPAMSATVLVLANDYWDETDKRSGRFTIDNVPPGTYTLVAWLPNSVNVSRKVTVQAGKNTRVSLQIAPGEEPKDHLTKDDTIFDDY